MIIKETPNNNFHLTDNSLITAPISDAAYRLYGLYVKLKISTKCTDKFAAKTLGWDIKKVQRAKKELRDSDLVYVHQVSSRIFYMFVGYSGKSASYVFSKWQKTQQEKVVGENS